MVEKDDAEGYYKKLITFRNFYIRKDEFGRIVFDKCKSDLDHLINPVLIDNERSKCRYLLDDLISKTLLGRQGSWTIDLTFAETGSGIQQTIESLESMQLTPKDK